MRITWKEYEVMLSTIFEEIENKDYDVVVGVTRGGLVPAVHLSNLLAIPMEVINLQTRDGDGKLKGKLPKKYKKPLIVDDICDTGRTVEELGINIPNADFAVLIDKGTSARISYSGTEHSRNGEWIVFPWEL